MHTLAELRAEARRILPREGVLDTALRGLTLMRAEALPLPTPLVYTPRLCIGIEGTKEIAVGDELIEYGPGEELVVSVAVPITGRVRTVPYASLVVALDLVEIAALHLEVPAPDAPDRALLSGPASPELIDAATRALRMLERPSEVTTLGPLVMREILFRVLSGPRGVVLRRLALSSGYVAQIAEAIAFLRARYAEPIDVEQLAQQARMSTTTFHRHFKALTHLSPLQYQKQLRLQEARHLLLGEALDVATASLRVGYESATQFTREYARLFGAPPRRDTERLRAGLSRAGA